jgi:CheY-like chemotaxis protein
MISKHNEINFIRTIITNESKATTTVQKRILVVDDEPDLTMICSLALQYHEFKVDTSNGPQEALSNFKPGYYDLVILDIKMPKIDGFELYEKIKKKEDKVKICLLTVSELYYIMKNFEKKNILHLIRIYF